VRAARIGRREVTAPGLDRGNVARFRRPMLKARSRRPRDRSEPSPSACDGAVPRVDAAREIVGDRCGQSSVGTSRGIPGRCCHSARPEARPDRPSAAAPPTPGRRSCSAYRWLGWPAVRAGSRSPGSGETSCHSPRGDRPAPEACRRAPASGSDRERLGRRPDADRVHGALAGDDDGGPGGERAERYDAGRAAHRQAPSPHPPTIATRRRAPVRLVCLRQAIVRFRHGGSIVRPT